MGGGFVVVRFQILLVCSLICCCNLSWGTRFVQEAPVSRKVFLRKTFMEAHAWIQDEDLLRTKYQKLVQSPFAFLRGTAFLYYLDLKSPSGYLAGPWDYKQVPEIWIQGDFHLQNIGFQEVEGKIFLDLNDFDEASVGPFHWDLLRGLVSSIFFLEDLPFPVSERKLRVYLASFLDSYRRSLKKRSKPLDLKNLKGMVRIKGERLKKDKSLKKLLKKWTRKTEDSAREFRLDHPKLEPLSSREVHAICERFASYSSKVMQESGLDQSYFTLKTLARKIGAGLGSLGVDRYLILLEGPGPKAKNDIILQLKQERRPSSLAGRGSSHGSMKASEGERVVHAMKNLLPYADPLTGALEIGDKSFLVTRVSAFEKGFKPLDFENEEDCREFMELSGIILAQAHLRGAKSSLLGRGFSNTARKFLKEDSIFRLALLKTAMDYAEQVRLDRSLLEELIDAKELP